MIYLSDHLPTDGSDAGPALRSVLAGAAGETVVVDGDWTVRSKTSKNAVLVLETATRLVGPGRLAYQGGETPGDSLRMITARPGAVGLEIRDVTVAHRPGRLPNEQSHAIFMYGGQTDGVIVGVTVEIAEGGDGIYLGNGTSRWRIEDCHVQDHARSAYVVAGSGQGRSDLLVRNCTADWSPGFPYPGGRLVDFETATGQIVERIRIVGVSGPGGIETNEARGEIRGCRSGMHVHVRTRGLVIDACVINETRPNYDGIRTIREQALTLTNCSIRSESGHGIRVENIVSGGGLWASTGKEVYLRGGNNHALLRDAAKKGIARFYKTRNPEDIIEDPTVWGPR